MVQISHVNILECGKLSHIPNFSCVIEVIGDSLSAAQYATHGGLATVGLGHAEYSITVYSDICLFDK
jgi:hypothetical protein